MTDNKIMEEFEKWMNDPVMTKEESTFPNQFEDSEAEETEFLAHGFYAGFRASERLAKIEVLELARQMFLDLDEMNPIDYTDSFDVINTLLEELKEGGK